MRRGLFGCIRTCQSAEDVPSLVSRDDSMILGVGEHTHHSFLINTDSRLCDVSALFFKSIVR